MQKNLKINLQNVEFLSKNIVDLQNFDAIVDVDFDIIHCVLSQNTQSPDDYCRGQIQDDEQNKFGQDKKFEALEMQVLVGLSVVTLYFFLQIKLHKY